MQHPPRPADELDRLRSLERLQLLDTAAEHRFDRIVRMASRLFQVPIALVSLVDEDRQWFKAAVGLDAAQTSRALSFCGHAILGSRPLIVRDARVDPRFSGNPLVLGEPHIRFYAGRPIAAPDGARVGTLCVIDREPRRPSLGDVTQLEDLAELVEEQLAHSWLSRAQRRLLAELAAANKRLWAVDQATRAWQLSYIVETLTREIERSRAHGGSVGALLVRSWGSQRVRRQDGDPAGDRALRLLADELRRRVRRFDALGRVGEDELLIVLPDCTAVRLQRFRQELTPVADGFELELAGVLFPRDGGDADRVLEALRVPRSCERRVPTGSPPIAASG